MKDNREDFMLKTEITGEVVESLDVLYNRYQSHIQPSERRFFCAQIAPFSLFSDTFINLEAG